jgi:hypothetical protein
MKSSGYKVTWTRLLTSVMHTAEGIDDYQRKGKRIGSGINNFNN